VGTQHYFSKADPKLVKKPEPVVSLPAMDVPPVEPESPEPIVQAIKMEPVFEKVELPIDPDGDGVLNNGEDLCPETPAGKQVNKQGCWILGKIFFRFEKADIQPHFTAKLDRMVEILKADPSLQVELGGHTDNLGAESLNEDLSGSRAIAVKKYFTEQGIDSARMTSIGFGLSRPDTDNATVVNRYHNRRVEIHPYK
jgi:OmpA-OmpF porin, OOP family